MPDDLKTEEELKPKKSEAEKKADLMRQKKAFYEANGLELPPEEK